MIPTMTSSAQDSHSLKQKPEEPSSIDSQRKKQNYDHYSSTPVVLWATQLLLSFGKSLTVLELRMVDCILCVSHEMKWNGFSTIIFNRQKS